MTKNSKEIINAQLQIGQEEFEEAKKSGDDAATEYWAGYTNALLFAIRKIESKD